MSAKILDGKSLALQIKEELKLKVEKLKGIGIEPRLDILVSANDPASIAYVNMKCKWAAQLGIQTETYEINESSTLKGIVLLLDELNENPQVHGILVQHPLPSHIDEKKVLSALGSKKDVDGMSPQSLGLLASGMSGFRCATALGIMTLLDRNDIEIEGKNALVIGRSIIVGKPVSLLLLQKNATVTIAHSKTQNLPDICRNAEIVVVAVGKPEMITGEWLRSQAVVVDAGYNKVEGRTHDVGDVHFESTKDIASWITPVPGGVGPMTVATLFRNVIDAAKKTIS